MNFYDVKARERVEVPNANCTKVAYGKGTGNVRYAFRGVSPSGGKLTKFCSKADFDAATDIPEVEA